MGQCSGLYTSLTLVQAIHVCRDVLIESGFDQNSCNYVPDYILLIYLLLIVYLFI